MNKLKIKDSMNKGFTLMELMVVIAIIVLLAGIMTPNVAKRLEKAKMTRAEADISAIETAIGMYENDLGRYPESIGGGVYAGLSAIQVLELRLTGRHPITEVTDNLIVTDRNWHGPYIKGIEQDSWKQDYIYIKHTNPSTPPGPVATGYPFFAGDTPIDYPKPNYGGSVIVPSNLGYYIYSTGKNKKTGAVGNCEDDINNWDAKQSWREEY